MKTPDDAPATLPVATTEDWRRGWASGWNAAELQAPDPLPQWIPTHRHIKGTLYRVLHRAALEANADSVIVYESFQGDVWVRPTREFLDGRFTPLSEIPGFVMPLLYRTNES